jgi:hypothetical protein
VISGPGSLETPMTSKDFEAKFRRMAEPHISPSSQHDIIEFADRLKTMRSPGSGSPSRLEQAGVFALARGQKRDSLQNRPQFPRNIHLLQHIHIVRMSSKIRH